MTVLQSLVIKLLMLAITAGILYWALGTEAPEPERLAQSSVGPETINKLKEPAADDPELETGRKDPVLSSTQNSTPPALRTKF